MNTSSSFFYKMLSFTNQFQKPSIYSYTKSKIFPPRTTTLPPFLHFTPNNYSLFSSQNRASIQTINSSSSTYTNHFKTYTDPLKEKAYNMTVTPAPFIKDGSLMVNGKVVLTKNVPSNVTVSPVAGGGAFIGATSNVPSSRHLFSLGILQEYRYTCLFRHKIWWMIPGFGSLGRDVPIETQMLLMEVKQDSAVSIDNSSGESGDNTLYVLWLPVLEGQFRTTLQGTSTDQLQFCVESGDDDVQTNQVTEAVFINSGDNPFELIKNSIMILERHKGTFARIDSKKIPAHLDWFGWCTWDAFYKDVNPKGIKEGLESFLKGGCPPKFLIIDDGWQDTVNEFQKEGQPFIEGTEFSTRLLSIKESSKFRDSGLDFSQFVKLIKENYKLKLVYVWHALIGYWGGLSTSSEEMKKYNPVMRYPVESPGNVGNLRDVALDAIAKYGVGLIDPHKINDFYNDQHSYLSKSGIDGVKVDVQNLAETLGGGYGGRVSITKQYQEALEESVSRNFDQNNLICCMSLNSDSIYSSSKSATARASEDFMPREPAFQTIHVASVCFNSLLIGEIVVPDWDMFQSNHYTAEFHGAARALGGCAVYVSDKPGTHDFKLLKKLVLPDGSILRARYAGRPTRDCLFLDTVMDGKSLLKIWNVNKLSAVVGVFNCQGCGNWPLKDGPEYNRDSSSKSLVLSGHISPLDVDYLGEVADESWLGDCAVYSFHKGSLSRLSKEGRIEVSLSTLECEIFTISPISVLNETLQFAPVGLIDMYNSGGATESVRFTAEPSVIVEARGCGRFGSYSSKKPVYCTVDGKKEEFEYDEEKGFLIVKLEGECKIRNIHICY